MVLMENWTPCMAKLEKLASHSVPSWTSTNKKITSHGPLQHESLFPSGSKSPLTKNQHIDPWFSTPCMLYSLFGRQLASCNKIKKIDVDKTIDDASYSKLYVVAACLGPDFCSNPYKLTVFEGQGQFCSGEKKDHAM